ncbi:PIN domain-containing protein [Halobaculum magnesiiphilum]|uniref:Ribonuclease VapC n=1 Tax=Halobaculum magnesiiphilum TaxID=1017351 RepID=A0A8T8WI35_9EURY|nr:PIN domain-containing protein [Halobaculum magnesiiphilum]QZP39498.1 PIN domain-containing protein [Halobaculum magnesiiphilum]
MILDTAFILDLMDNLPEAHEKLDELETNGAVLKLSTMTLTELYIGIEAYAGEEEEREIRRILQGVPRVDMDPQIAEEAGRMIGRLDPSKYKRKKGDAVIAATTEVEGEVVVTRNVDDFERHGVPVESY